MSTFNKQPKKMSDDRTEATAEEINAIKEWMKQETYLPKSISDILLRRFLHGCHYSLQQTKQAIISYFAIRHSAPEIFANRDPDAAEIQHAFKTVDLVPLDKLSPDNYNVFIYKLHDFNPDEFHFNPIVKAYFMLADVRLESEKTISMGDVPIFDMAGVTLKHITKMINTTLKNYMKYSQEGHPVRLTQIHIINCPSYVDMLFNVIKPLMKSHLLQVLHFHTPDSDTLYKFLPKEMLPEDYGGKCRKIADMKKEWIDKVNAERKYFLDDSKWKIDESKMPKDSFENSSSFKTLSFD